MRNYKKKENPKQVKNKVTKEQIDTALHHIKNNNYSKRQAAKKAGIKEGTLRWILKKRENVNWEITGKVINCKNGMKTAMF